MTLPLAAGLLLAGAGCQSLTPPEELTHWPDGTSPQEIGRRVAGNFVVRPLQYETDPAHPSVIYPEVCAWCGALAVARLTGDRDLQARLIKKFEPLLTPEGAAHLPLRPHVDDRVFGAVPLEIYRLTRDPKYLEIGRSFADRQWEKTTPDGITAEARYWIDDMYMITMLQVQTYRATRDDRYIDRAARTMAAYLDRLQQPGGLFYHAPDSPFYWSRGNGWVAAGMTELLRAMPSGHPQRGRILTGYQKMMAALVKYQGADGLWRQLVDHAGAWPETSGTGMFTYAMITGVKEGWLDAGSYGAAARAAWLGLIKYLDQDANIGNVCVATGAGNSVEYYLARPRHAGDLHGQAPIMWCAAALLR
ncbi:MAG TPA: glycoside hydrolase family 88 protein [Opitutaceae bacterium]|nr:glycoside hydrolase family 88 protein [Opitutaceae bacterium]